MFSLHAIVLRGKAFFGKGQYSEDAVRTRLLPEHDGCEIVLGEPIASKAELDMRFLILLDHLRTDYPQVDGQWYPLDRVQALLHMAGALRSNATPPAFLSSAESLASFRQHLGVDQGVLAAMMGTERTRVHRLEQGKSKFTFDDFRRLRYWAGRMNALTEFMSAFPLGPLADAPGGPIAVQMSTADMEATRQ